MSGMRGIFFKRGQPVYVIGIHIFTQTLLPGYVNRVKLSWWKKSIYSCIQCINK